MQVSKRERGESKKCKGQAHVRVSAREGKIGSERGKGKERERLKGNGRVLQRVHVDNTHGASKATRRAPRVRRPDAARQFQGGFDLEQVLAT